MCIYGCCISMIKLNLFISVIGHLTLHNNDENQFHEAVSHGGYTRT